MLRHYDEIGLLVPKTIDGFTSYRLYHIYVKKSEPHIEYNLGFHHNIGT